MQLTWGKLRMDKAPRKEKHRKENSSGPGKLSFSRALDGQFSHGDSSCCNSWLPEGNKKAFFGAESNKIEPPPPARGCQMGGREIGRRGMAALSRKVVSLPRVLIPARPLPRTDTCSHLDHSERC